MKTEKTSNSQNNLDKKEQSWRHHAFLLQTTTQSYNNKKSMVQPPKQTNQWKRIEPRNKQYIPMGKNATKELRIYHVVKKVSWDTKKTGNYM